MSHTNTDVGTTTVAAESVVGQKVTLASPSIQEFQVSFVLALILGVFALLFFVVYRFASEERKRTAIPLLTFICFFSADSIYRAWAELESFYGSRPLEFALARTLLLCASARILASRYFSPSATNAEATANGKKGISEPPVAQQGEIWLFWFPLMGILWGIEECLVAFPESLIGLILSSIAMCYRFRSIGSPMGSLFVPITVAGMLMAKSGSISLHSGLAGMIRTFRLLLLEALLVRVGPLSPLLLTWAPGIWAALVTGLGYLIFEFFRPVPQGPDASRGILDYIAAAGLGMFFALASTLAMFETMVSSSLLSMQAATCFAEILFFCLLTPLAGLPLGFHVILGLNIAGIILTFVGSLVIIKTDRFLSPPRIPHTLFKFLDEEEEQDAQPSGTIREIDEDEWLLTIKQSKAAGTNV